MEKNEPGNEPELKDFKELLDQINDAEKENVTSKKKMDKMDWEAEGQNKRYWEQ